MRRTANSAFEREALRTRPTPCHIFAATTVALVVSYANKLLKTRANLQLQIAQGGGRYISADRLRSPVVVPVGTW